MGLVPEAVGEVGEVVMSANATLSYANLSQQVIRSILARFGYDQEGVDLSEFGLFKARSAERYRGGAILPLSRWLEFNQALKDRHPERAAILFPGDELLTVGCLLHQGHDANDAWDKGTPRSRRYVIPATPTDVGAAGERILAGEHLPSDPLLAARYVTAHVTSEQRLRSSGGEVLERLCRALLEGETAYNHRNTILNEALRNVPSGVAADTLVEILADPSQLSVCPCTAMVQLLITDSKRVSKVVNELLSDPSCWGASHIQILLAARNLRLPLPWSSPPEPSCPTLIVAEAYLRYLEAIDSATVPSRGAQVARMRLLADLRERVPEVPSADAAQIQRIILNDRTGLPLTGDLAVGKLWRAALLHHDSDQRAIAAQILKNIGVAAEGPLRRLAIDHGVCLRVRVHAIAALSVFPPAIETERSLRSIAESGCEDADIRVHALWAYRHCGADTGWMFRLLADPSSAVREALMSAAIKSNTVGVILAGLVDRNPNVSAAALQKYQGLKRVGQVPRTLL
jgi:hypothetical protein